ncbi:MAG: AAA family ATPase [Oscillospiraceae bacterium]|nr:AAA family ATPase [Oscillospiraceae bacterium]
MLLRSMVIIMKIKIAIADNEIAYINKLFSVFERKENVSVSMFTETESLKKALNNQNYDILIINPELDSDTLNYKKATVVVFLSDNSSSTFNVSCQDYSVVLKYQQISKIFNEIINIYSEIVPTSGMDGRSTIAKIIPVYSPAGGTGKTTVALSVAEMLVNRGYKVLYINFEMISSYGTYLPQNNGRNFGDIISKMGVGFNWKLKIESIIQTTQKGIMYFEEFKNIFDVYEISAADAEMLVNGIASAGVCDYLIIDMDNDLSAVNRKIMSISDIVVAVAAASETASYKFNKFLEHFDIIVENTDKLNIVCNFGKQPDNAISAYPVIANIPQINSGFKNVIDYINKNSLINIENLM